MAINTCSDCGSPFHVADDETWKTRCLPCWRASKGEHWRPLGEAARLREELATAELKLGIANMRIEQLEAKLARTANVELDPSMLRLLVQLTHPDKHDNSPAAAKAAAYLNDLRRARR